MPASTREAIMEAAKRLFNERGFNAVSVGDIAQAAGISKGNLTYHFKRKEDIVRALLDAAPDTCPKRPAATLDELDAIFLDLQNVVTENAYYFWHYAQLAQVSPGLRESQQRNSAYMLEILRGSLRALAASGALQPEPAPGFHDALANQLLMAAVYWIPYCGLRGLPRTSFRDHAWHLMQPSLADIPA